MIAPKMLEKRILAAVAILLTIVAFWPYIRSVISGDNRPHVFSWLIWGSTTFIVFLAQLADHGGAGSWPIGVSGIITLYVTFLAYRKRADRNITRSDWVFFILALGSLPAWFFTADPLWAVVILTFVDGMGFGPTFTKSYARPFEEPLSFFVLMAVRNLIAIAALENYSLTTVLFPAVIGLLCWVYIVMVMARRRQKNG